MKLSLHILSLRRFIRDIADDEVRDDAWKEFYARYAPYGRERKLYIENRHNEKVRKQKREK